MRAPSRRKERFCTKCGKKTMQRKVAGSSVFGCIICLLVPSKLSRGQRECPGPSCAAILPTRAKTCTSCGWDKAADSAAHNGKRKAYDEVHACTPLPQ